MDDMIATLEQENRQLHARNERLEKELKDAEQGALAALRDKLKMHDKEKFNVFCTASKNLTACFSGANNGVLITHIDSSLEIMGLNNDAEEALDVLLRCCDILLNAIESDKEERVLN